jgi:hypothetical protein
MAARRWIAASMQSPLPAEPVFPPPLLVQKEGIGLGFGFQTAFRT